MSTLSQSQKVVQFLIDNPKERFGAKAIAEAIVERYPEDYVEKRKNPRFPDSKSFINQIVAEIGAQKDRIVGHNKHIFWQDKPRPRVYWYDPDQSSIDATDASLYDELDGDEVEIGIVTSTNNPNLSEIELYPLLMEYLKTELKLYCLRIDEKRSKNSRGSGGNQWLHPDIVAMQPVDKAWNGLIRSCVQQGAGQRVRLWSFEVKKELNGSNVRKSYFQAVSNSSWANEGYLVGTSIADATTENELRMLSALHGIGFILLNPENPSESEIVLPARSRSDVDWESTNRILLENKDFSDFIELVSTYYQTGRVRPPKDWNQI